MMNANSVRRSLFHGNLSRRPASSGPPNAVIPPNPNGVSNRPSNRLKPTSSESGPQARPFKMENKDIVAKDKNGDYRLEVPILPPALVGEDGEELVEPEEGGLNATELTGQEKERFNEALVEMITRYRKRQTDDELNDILKTVHESLREKVASLDDDNWMFEPEKGSFSN